MIPLHAIIRVSEASEYHERFGTAIGAVVHIYDHPSEACEVEFCNDEGVPIDTVTLTATDIILVGTEQS